MLDVALGQSADRRARCEMDLSPGTRSVPARVAPPGTVATRRVASVRPRQVGRHRTEPRGCALAAMAAGHEGRHQIRCRLLVDDQHEHALAALDRVGDLEVDHADAQLGRHGQDLGELAGTVDHRDAHLDQALGPGYALGQGPPGGGGPVEHLEQPVPVAVGHPPAHVGQGGDERVERVDDGPGVLVADVGPDAGLPGGDPGHVAEAAGRQLEQGGVLLADPAGQVHEGGRGQVRHVGHHGHQRVVLLGGRGRARWPRGRRGSSAGGRRRRGRSRPPG